jgi:sugar phosphate isomerase/epimerase
MFDVAISELTTARWELRQELAHSSEHGFAAVSLWRPKLSDDGAEAAAAHLARAGMRASSLQWAGGFTGSDGRSFRESLRDAADAIEAAAVLALASPLGQPPVVIVHAGCRGGHTRSHAARLLLDALDTLVPLAAREGVVLALEPVHPRAALQCGFLTSLDAALDIVEEAATAHLRLALDLWHFGDVIDGPTMLGRLAAATALVQVADRCGSPTGDADRQPAGMGCLPLEDLVGGLVEHGYRGDFEFDPVGETVEMLGYEGTLHETRRVVDAWSERLAARQPATRHASSIPAGDVQTTAKPWADAGRGPDPLTHPRGAYLRPATAGSLRSQASSHTVSRG